MRATASAVASSPSGRTPRGFPGRGVQQPPLAVGDHVGLVAADADSGVVVDGVDGEVEPRRGLFKPLPSPVREVRRVQVRLDVPVEQPERRAWRRLAEEPQVLLLAERLAGSRRQVPAEDHRAGTDADVDLRLQDLRHLGGQAVRGDAVREVVVITARGVDDIGVPQPSEYQLSGQAVQFKNVEFAPAEAVQPVQVLHEPAVVPRGRDRRRVRGRGPRVRP